MGPPEFTGGNVDGAYVRQRQELKLQWGRRNSPAETWRVVSLQHTADNRASMGPPEFTGGNDKPAEFRFESTRELQWGLLTPVGK